MPSTPRGYQRRNSLRHPGYDYAQPGAYFVTICAFRGRQVFGRITGQTVKLTPIGSLADGAWHDLAARHSHVEIDTFITMPNHVHVLLWLNHQQNSETRTTTGFSRKYGNAIAGSLSTIIGAYKSSVTMRATRDGLIPGPPLWQANFYDRIVKDELGLQRVRNYIRENPARWLADRFNPGSATSRSRR